MLTIVIVLAGWVALSLPLGVVVGSLFAHQRRHESGMSGLPVQSPALRVPAQAGAVA